MDACAVDFIAEYRPTHVSRPSWTAIEIPVRQALTVATGAADSSQPRSSDAVARAMASRVAGFAAWLHAEAIPVSLEALADVELVERYISVGMDGAADSTRASTRAILRRVAARLAPVAEPEPEQLRYRRVKPPYAPWEVEGFLRCARQQPTATLRSQSLAVLCLGLGCGLDSRDLAWVRGCDVRPSGDGVIEVAVSGGTRPRRVIALSRFADDITARAETAGDGLMIGGTLLGRRNVTSSVLGRFVTDRNLPRLAMGRLRSTWLVAHLDRATPLTVLMPAAGLATVRPLEDLLPYAQPVDEPTVRLALAGVTNPLGGH